MEAEGAKSPGPGSEFEELLQALGENGRVVVSSKPPGEPAPSIFPLLERLDGQARMELGLDAPSLNLPAAVWAARLFYQLCQFTVCRDIGEERIVAVCAAPFPESRGPETDWSVDLLLRHLPKLFQLARHLSNSDPLVRQLKQIAAAWPLSSVGIPGLENLRVDSFIGHAGLRRIYADRIIDASDVGRLGNSQVDDMLRGDLGIHRELAPAIAAGLFATT